MSLLLYNSMHCPFCMRARIALNISRLSFKIQEVDFVNKPPEMLKLSPKGTVPVLVNGDKVIDESSDIIEYSIAQKPDLWLDDKTIEAKEFVQKYWPILRTVSNPKFSETIELIEQELSKHNYLFGDKPSFADVALVPFIIRLKDESTLPNKVKQWLDLFLN